MRTDCWWAVGEEAAHGVVAELAVVDAVEIVAVAVAEVGGHVGGVLEEQAVAAAVAEDCDLCVVVAVDVDASERVAAVAEPVVAAAAAAVDVDVAVVVVVVAVVAEEAVAAAARSVALYDWEHLDPAVLTQSWDISKK